MPPKALGIEQILTILAEGPPRLAEFTIGLTTAQLHATPGPGEWSANEVLAHLRACADVWGNCIAAITNQDRPTIRAVNPRTWIQGTDYPEQEFRSSLQAFTAQRTALLAVLESLSPEDWSRSAVVTGAGKPLERSVHSYAQWMAEHERPHVKQIKRIAATMRNQQ
ncbi:MAG TPA: DinB family protein [Anaerolineales bacterium]|nr:DinB family protein [Anaerolineales bacterium]